MATRTPDPRTITPEALGVAPELLGLPLATPRRRALAMLFDLIPLAILLNANALVLAIAAAVMLWRASTPSIRTGPVRRGVRGLLRVGAAVLAFIVALRVGGALFGDDEEDEPRDDAGSVAFATDMNLPEELRLEFGDVARLPDFVGLVRADDPAETRRYAGRVAAWLAAKDMPPERRREAAVGLLGSIDDASQRAVAESVFVAAVGTLPRAPAGDSAVIAYAAALAQGDTGTVLSLRDEAAAAIAGDRMASLQSRVGELESERNELQREIGRAGERRNLTTFIRSIGDDLGIGFGWGAVYFTSFLALWRGYTPGKRLVGIRVIRLDGKPLGWWRSFERFGGYAASLSTGLLGFLQILWHRNRQGLHDKAADTVVIRTGRSARTSAIKSPTSAGSPPAPR